MYPTAVKHPEEFWEIFRSLQHRIGAVKMRSVAVMADAHAVRERIRRSRAQRAGSTCDPPESIENFVKDRSNYNH